MATFDFVIDLLIEAIGPTPPRFSLVETAKAMKEQIN